jgi:hypothetical protein
MFEDKKALLVIINLVMFIVGMALVIEGRNHLGIPGLLAQLGGLAILLIQLYWYNKRHR